jgi:hypothetical protein
MNGKQQTEIGKSEGTIAFKSEENVTYATGLKIPLTTFTYEK